MKTKLDLSRIEVVFFDLGGTLLHPVSVGEVYARVGKKHGSRTTVDEACTRFRAAFRRQEVVDRAAGWLTGREREEERWRAIVRETLPDLDDFESCFLELYRFYASADGWLLDEDAPAVLAVLQARGIKTGIASNYDERLFQVVRGVPALASMSPIVVSSRVGYRKPSPQFFAAMEEGCGTARDRILLIGDDLESDYLGATACGMQTLLLDAKGTHAGEKVMRVGSLREAMTLLE